MENNTDQTTTKEVCVKCRSALNLPMVREKFCDKCGEKLIYTYRFNNYCNWCGRRVEYVGLKCNNYAKIREKWNSKHKISNGHFSTGLGYV